MKVSCVFLTKDRKVVRKRLKLDGCNCVNLKYDGEMYKFIVPAKPSLPLVYTLDNPNPLSLYGEEIPLITAASLHQITDTSILKALRDAPDLLIEVRLSSIRKCFRGLVERLYAGYRKLAKLNAFLRGVSK